MGQAGAHPCCGCGGPKDATQRDEARIVPVHAVELDDVSTAAEADVNEALLDAVGLARRGMYSEAMVRLLDAECMLDDLPTSPTASQLRRSYFTDPELQEIKIKTPKPARRPVSFGFSRGPGELEDSPQAPFAVGDRQGPTREPSPPDDRGQRLAALEADLKGVQELCFKAYIFEAKAALDGVERTLRELGGVDAAVAAFRRKLSSDPQLTKLRTLSARMREAVALATRSVGTQAPPPVVIQEPTLGEGFRLELTMRQAVGAERDAKGAVTQLILIAKVMNWPLSLMNTIAVDCECDLFQKEWIKDCKNRSATPGGPSAIYSNICTLQVALSPLPIQLEEVQIREFAVFDTPPLPDLRPGVLVLESGPPVESGTWENWNVPRPSSKRGCYRLGATKKVHYKMQSTTCEHCCDLVTVSTVGLPVPQWLLPIEKFKEIIAEKIRGSLKMLKGELVDKFADHGYEDRIRRYPEFYEAVRGVSHA